MSLKAVPNCDPSQDATYPAIDPNKVKYVEIFPPIGIARVGNSYEYFFAPEVPRRTTPPTHVENFRDSYQRMRRQAVRFRVYAYDDQNQLLGEVNEKVDGYTLKWKVQVANKKASFTVFQGRFPPHKTNLRNPDVRPGVSPDSRQQLIVDSGVKEVNRTSGSVSFSGRFNGSNPKPTSIYLGEGQSDDAGRLIFIAGDGDSRCVTPSAAGIHPEIISEFDNTDWVDNVCDGWVSVEVKNSAWTQPKSGRKATVISAPPKFSWGIYMPTSLYDTIEDIYDPPTQNTTVDFNKHIRPVLLSPCSLSWVNNIALKGHGTYGKGDFLSLLKNTKTREEAQLLTNRIFYTLRKPYDHENPDLSQGLTKYMPYLSGDKGKSGDATEPGTINLGDRQSDPGFFASLTKLQYERFKIWKDNFIFPFPDDEVYPPNIEGVPLDKQPEYLTRASLEATIGDPLFPGIEMYWIAKEKDTYDPIAGDKPIYPPFRINHDKLLPGHLTRGLSLPWQCDFDLCNTHWWPASRPDVVVTKADYDAAMQGSGTTQEKFARAITTRRDWDRGLRETTDYITYPGSTDMIKYWDLLGIVRQIPEASETAAVYLESERCQLPPPS